MAFLVLMQGTHFYTVCAIFSFAGVLSADLNWVPDKNEAGAGWPNHHLHSLGLCGGTLWIQIGWLPDLPGRMCHRRGSPAADGCAGPDLRHRGWRSCSG